MSDAPAPAEDAVAERRKRVVAQAGEWLEEARKLALRHWPDPSPETVTHIAVMMSIEHVSGLLCEAADEISDAISMS